MMRIRDGDRSDPGWKKSDRGSRINIPDPQHCFFESCVLEISHLAAVLRRRVMKFTHAQKVTGQNSKFWSIYSLKMLKYSIIVWNYLFWPKNKTPFYRLISDPVLDPVLNPDSNPECLFRIRIGSGSGQKFQPYGSGTGSESATLAGLFQFAGTHRL